MPINPSALAGATLVLQGPALDTDLCDPASASELAQIDTMLADLGRVTSENVPDLRTQFRNDEIQAMHQAVHSKAAAPTPAPMTLQRAIHAFEQNKMSPEGLTAFFPEQSQSPQLVALLALCRRQMASEKLTAEMPALPTLKFSEQMSSIPQPTCSQTNGRCTLTVCKARLEPLIAQYATYYCDGKLADKTHKLPQAFNSLIQDEVSRGVIVNDGQLCTFKNLRKIMCKHLVYLSKKSLKTPSILIGANLARDAQQKRYAEQDSTWKVKIELDHLFVFALQTKAGGAYTKYHFKVIVM